MKSKLTLLALLFLTNCTAGGQKMAQDREKITMAPAHEKAASEFLQAYTAKWQPLFKEANLAWWEANTTGSDEAFKREEQAENALDAIYAQADDFKKITLWQKEVQDPALKRLLEVVYRNYLPKQVAAEKLAEITALSAKSNQTFNTHRSPVNGKELTENEVRAILSTSTNSAEVQAAWEGYHLVGEKVAGDLKKLVALRNEAAKAVGYDNYYQMSLAAMDIDENELFKLLDELADLTDKPFASLKAEIDRALAQKFAITPAELMPWHHRDLFFQEVPEISGPSLDAVYQKVDLLKIVPEYYQSIGLETAAILEKSSLFEAPGKSPHAFMIDIDREGDVRILTNLKNSAYWADTLLHELGHGVYQVNISQDLPLILRESAHECITEGVAMMFGSLAKDECFLRQAAGVEDSELIAAAKKSHMMDELIFSRWAQVMIRFERDLYEKPDIDHNKRWWELKKRYQLINTPEGRDKPDYAAKMHFIGAPVYYQNYLYGHLFAAQLLEHLRESNQLAANEGCFYGHKEVGEQLKRELFSQGMSLPWPKLVEKVTGAPLSAKAFSKEIATK